MAGEAGGDHWMRADALARVLAELPPETLVYPNRVLNLSFYDVDGNYYGYLDVLTEEMYFHVEDDDE